jgi:hypothetical protein
VNLLGIYGSKHAKTYIRPMPKHQPLKISWELKEKLHTFSTLTLRVGRAVRFKYQQLHTLVQTWQDITQVPELVWKCGKTKIYDTVWIINVVFQSISNPFTGLNRL